VHVRIIAGATSEASMSCPHGRASSPETCSQCIGATPRKVAQTDNLITVDGEVVRPIELEAWSPGVKRKQQQRGGRR
jgi:hypothetical protein